jgi:hypothetical protein
MNKAYHSFFLYFLSSIFFICCQNNSTPWGLWNKYNPSDGDEIKIRELSTGKYYEIALGGLYILKEGKELSIYKDIKSPIIAIQGDYKKIEKYEPIADGFVFYLVGNGFKQTPETMEFQNDIRIQVKMYFISKDECYFKYTSLYDSNGFQLSYFPEENIIYRRLRAKVTQR